MCNDCCEKQPLARMGFVDPVLVCMGCAPVCKMEDDFYKHHLKLLINGKSWCACYFGHVYSDDTNN